MDLFICTSPLQSLIASNVAFVEKVHDYDVLYYVDKMNHVHVNYLNKVSSSAKEVVVMDSLMLRFPCNIFFLRLIFRRRAYHRVFISSIEATYFHYLLSIIEFKELITFDDGTANIAQSSLYYVDRNNRVIKFFLKLLGVEYDLASMKQKSSKHYTIYSNESNIVENPIYIPLDIKANQSYDGLDNVDYIILGTVYDAIVDEKINADYIKFNLTLFIERLLNQGKKVVYIPHPKDNSICFDSFDESSFFYSLKSNLIAEDFIISMAKLGPLVVCGFGSSAQFNIRDIANVENVVFMSAKVSQTVRELHSMLNIRSINLDLHTSW